MLARQPQLLLEMPSYSWDCSGHRIWSARVCCLLLWLVLRLLHCAHKCGCFVTGDIPGCRAAFIDIIQVEPGCSSATVWLMYAAFELRFGADRVQDARQVFQAGLMSATMSESGRDEIWRRYLVRSRLRCATVLFTCVTNFAAACVQDFLEDCSASAEEIVLAEGQYRDWVADSDSRNNSTDPSLPASSQASGYDASKKRSALEMVQVCERMLTAASSTDTLLLCAACEQGRPNRGTRSSSTGKRVQCSTKWLRLFCVLPAILRRCCSRVRRIPWVRPTMNYDTLALFFLVTSDLAHRHLHFEVQREQHRQY
jgi:hypothetical protein